MRPLGSHTGRPSPRRKAVATKGLTFSIPAPHGGLNLRDAITALSPDQARRLINWRPSSGQLSARPGLTAHATGLNPSSCKQVAAFRSTTTEKLIAFTTTRIYDVTAAGAATELVNSMTNGNWSTALFGNRLSMVNGADTPRDFDGTTCATVTWTGSGLTATNLVNIAQVRNRIWFCEANQADVWYGGIASISGTVTKFQLSQIVSGGYCMAIGGWSRDAGDGMDDFTVFVMSTGQIAVYQGDPASTFSLVGIYGGDDSVPPIGRRCLIRLGGELLIITRGGLVPVSAMMSGLGLNLQALEPWGKIAPALAADAILHGARTGWQGALHDGFLYVTVPQSDTLSRQYVLNTRNGAWTVYSGLNCSSVASYGNELYMGLLGSGTVKRHAGDDDDGSEIVCEARGAYVVPSQSYASNQYTACRVKIAASGTVTGVIGVDTDYFEETITGDAVALIEAASETPWGSEWGSPWSSPPENISSWVGVVGVGRSVAVKLKVYVTSSDTKWSVTDVAFKPGNMR